MRVLHLTRDFPPVFNGGISTAVASLIAAIDRAGTSCSLVSFDGWRPVAATASEPARPRDEPGRPILRLSRPDQIGTLGDFARAARPDLLHVHDALLWETADGLRQELNVPAAYSIHVLHAEQQRLRGLVPEPMGAAAERRALEQADVLIAPSQAVVDLLLAAQPGLRDRLRRVSPGLDPPAAGSLTCGTDGNEPTGPILYAGRFSDLKGTGDLLACVGDVLARFPAAHFELAGGLPYNPSAQRRWKRRFEQSADPRIHQRVAWSGWLSPTALAGRYRRAAILCVPSHFETFGLSALEGMQQGLPVVAAGCAALAELIEHDRTGLLYEPGDRTGLVDCLVELLEKPERARRLGLAAARQVRERVRWPASLAALEGAYRLAHERFSGRRNTPQPTAPRSD